jgi:pyruvate formate lyase activating enzyme
MPADVDVSIKGLVFNIGRGSADDGPGLRTTVFMKGCPLKCIWCHSPESQRGEPELGFFFGRCIKCGTCFKTCEQGALVSCDNKRIQWEKCNNCLRCAHVCPSKALKVIGDWFTVAEIMDVIKRDIRFYKTSRGGVTFSGGEPLAQPAFLQACLMQCRKLGLHTAVDTCGFANWSVFKEILQYVNLFLYDIKLMDPQKHKDHTGFDNKLILNNLNNIRQHGKPVWIRVPLIPGYTDSEENISEIVKFIGELKNEERITLLPYNPVAGAKYQMVGRQYVLDDLNSQSQDRLAKLTKLLNNKSLPRLR